MLLTGSAAEWLRPACCLRSHARTHCAVNLKAIAAACLIYAESNGGELPPDLQTLVQGEPRAYLQPRQLICPNGGGNYVYIPGQHNRMDPRNIVAFEQTSNHRGEGANASFLDGHAQWKDPATLAAMLQETLDDVILGRHRGETATSPADDAAGSPDEQENAS